MYVCIYYIIKSKHMRHKKWLEVLSKKCLNFLIDPINYVYYEAIIFFKILKICSIKNSIFVIKTLSAN